MTKEQNCLTALALLIQAPRCFNVHFLGRITHSSILPAPDTLLALSTSPLPACSEWRIAQTSAPDGVIIYSQPSDAHKCLTRTVLPFKEPPSATFLGTN